MPSSTFDNLPADKRERFIEAALDEFSARPFDQASLSRVVARLGIAKGSVYQYFDDKADLFCWLVEEGGRRKQAFVQDAGLAAAGQGVLGSLRPMYAAGLRFHVAEPRWSQLFLRAREPSEHPRVAALRQGQDAAVHGFLVDLLTRARAAGELRADVDIAIGAHLLAGLLGDGLLRAFQADGGPAEAVVDQALALLQHGLRAPDGVP